MRPDVSPSKLLRPLCELYLDNKRLFIDALASVFMITVKRSVHTEQTHSIRCTDCPDVSGIKRRTRRGLVGSCKILCTT